MSFTLFPEKSRTRRGGADRRDASGPQLLRGGAEQDRERDQNRRDRNDRTQWHAHRRFRDDAGEARAAEPERRGAGRDVDEQAADRARLRHRHERPRRRQHQRHRGGEHDGNHRSAEPWADACEYARHAQCSARAKRLREPEIGLICPFFFFPSSLKAPPRPLSGGAGRAMISTDARRAALSSGQGGSTRRDDMHDRAHEACYDDIVM